MKPITAKIRTTLVPLWNIPRWYFRNEKINEEYRGFRSHYERLFTVIESQLK